MLIHLFKLNLNTKSDFCCCCSKTFIFLYSLLKKKSQNNHFSVYISQSTSVSICQHLRSEWNHPMIDISQWNWDFRKFKWRQWSLNEECQNQSSKSGIFFSYTYPFSTLLTALIRWFFSQNPILHWKGRCPHVQYLFLLGA